MYILKLALKNLKRTVMNASGWRSTVLKNQNEIFM